MVVWWTGCVWLWVQGRMCASKECLVSVSVSWIMTYLWSVTLCRNQRAEDFLYCFAHVAIYFIHSGYQLMPSANIMWTRGYFKASFKEISKTVEVIKQFRFCSLHKTRTILASSFVCWWWLKEQSQSNIHMITMGGVIRRHPLLYGSMDLQAVAGLWTGALCMCTGKRAWDPYVPMYNWCPCAVQYSQKQWSIFP